MQCYSKTAAEHFICVKAHRILVFNKEIAGLWFVFRICQGDYGTHTRVGWGKGFQAVSPPFCLWGLITHQWTVSRSTDWELSGTSLTRRWQYQMEKLHTCSSCFHYPSAGHWPSTKSLCMELSLLSPWVWLLLWHLLPLPPFYCNPTTLPLTPDFVLA